MTIQDVRSNSFKIIGLEAELANLKKLYDLSDSDMSNKYVMKVLLRILNQTK